MEVAAALLHPVGSMHLHFPSLSAGWWQGGRPCDGPAMNLLAFDCSVQRALVGHQGKTSVPSDEAAPCEHKVQ